MEVLRKQCRRYVRDLNINTSKNLNITLQTRLQLFCKICKKPGHSDSQCYSKIKKFSKGQFSRPTSESRKSPAGRKPTVDQRVARNGSNEPRNLRPGDTGHRISVISGRLYSIRGQFLGTRGPVKLLVESGASLNVIKNGALQKNHLRHHEKTEFFMGNDRHEARETVSLTLENVMHTFVVVPDNFPLSEDGIAGNPFLHSYEFNLTNRSLELNGRIYLLEDNGILIPKNTVFITLETKRKEGEVIIENNAYIPDSIYCINDSKATHMQ